MKIMKVKDKTIGDKTYIKYRINLPLKVVEETGLHNKELKVVARNNKIVVEEK